MKKDVYFKSNKFIQASIKTVTEGSLFHYTDSLNTLDIILETGFRYSYSFEEHSKRVAKGEDWTLLDNMTIMGAPRPQYGIAAPMICFCDIPLLKAAEHRAKYGNYCVGVNKELLRKELPMLNPLLYITSNWVYDAIEKLENYISTQEQVIKYHRSIENVTKGIDDPIKVAGAINKAKKEGKIANDVRYETDFYSAVKTLVSLVKKYEGTDARYYNEHEWRVFFTEAGDPKYGFTREQFEEQKKELNEKLWYNKEKSYLKFDNQGELITYIIVSKEEEIPIVINKIRELNTILGKPIPQNQESYIKDILISKITSFERIEADY